MEDLGYMEPLLDDQAKIDALGGADVYIRMNRDCILSTVKYKYLLHGEVRYHPDDKKSNT